MVPRSRYLQCSVHLFVVRGEPSTKMANPRKFSEKIAMHEQKRAEELAAFEQIMREVGMAVPKGSAAAMSPSGPQPVFNNAGLLQPFHRGCGGSLPNVNQMAGYPLAHAQTGYQEPHGLAQGVQPTYSPDQRSPGFGPQRNPRACDRRRETSPYSPPGQTFLSPPSDSGWRRTHSDSALHRTLQQSECYSPSLQRRAGGGSGGVSGGSGLHEVPGSGGSSPAPPPGHWNPFDPKLGHVPVSGSPGTDQRVPGPGALLPDGRPPLNGLAPAGSLPDLTPGPGFAAPQPPSRPPQDGDDLSRTPPYSPVYPAPSSPGQHQPPRSIPALPTSQRLLSVPQPVGPAGFLRPFKAAVGPPSPELARKAPFQPNFGADTQQPQQQQQPEQQQQIQQQQPPVSPDMMNAFRTPRLRPRSVSPQPFGQPGYSPPSPLDGGFPPSPASPAAQSPASNNGFYSAPQARQMQQQFEQFNMGISRTVNVPSGGGQPIMAGSSDLSQQSTPQTPTSSIPEIILSDFSTEQQQELRDMRDANDILQDGDFSSASELQQQELLRDMRDANDILQDGDFSSASELQQQELLRDMRDANDILQGSGGNFDGEDLGELDLEGLRMLTNPDGHVIDASSDDYFRMESLGGP